MIIHEGGYIPDWEVRPCPHHPTHTRQPDDYMHALKRKSLYSLQAGMRTISAKR